MSFVTTWMDLECIMLSEINQKKILHDLTYMWNLKNKQTNKKGKQTNRYREETE